MTLLTCHTQNCPAGRRMSVPMVITPSQKLLVLTLAVQGESQ